MTGHNVEKMFTALATTIKHQRIDQFEGAGAAGGIHGAGSHDNASTANESRTVNLSSGENNGGGGPKASSCCQ